MATGFISNIDLILLIETSCHFSFTIHYVNILKIKFLSPVTFWCIKLLATLVLIPQCKGLTQFILLTWAILNGNHFLSTLETAFGLILFFQLFLNVTVTQQLNLFLYVRKNIEFQQISNENKNNTVCFYSFVCQYLEVAPNWKITTVYTPFCLFP